MHDSSSPEWPLSSEGFDNAPCGFLVLDCEGKILESNNRLRDWLGKNPDELNSTLGRHVFSVASRIVFETSIVPLLSLKGKVDGASLDLNGDGDVKVPVLMSAETSGRGADKVTTLIFLQAGARRNFERDLAAARAEAEEKLSTTQREGELREQFVAILGHDLRNPLASISSGVRMLLKEPLSDRGTEIVKLTQGSVQRMSLLIDNILDFARNRLGGGIELNYSAEVTLETEIRQVVEEIRSAHTDRDIRLELAELDGVECDVSRVGQLLSNLLGNALTYGDPATDIHVTLEITNEGHFELAVTNSGKPIPPSAIERLFDPFVRSTNHEDRMGLGLGLFIASEIAKAHGGTLDVLSNDARTKFTFQIPNARHRVDAAGS